MPVKHSSNNTRPDKYPAYASAGAFEIRKPGMYRMGDYLTRKLGSAATAETTPKKAKEITYSAEMLAAASNPRAVQVERAAEIASSKRQEAKARAKAERVHEFAAAKQQLALDAAASKKDKAMAVFQKSMLQSVKPIHSAERRTRRANVATDRVIAAMAPVINSMSKPETTKKPTPSIEISDALRERARLAMANNRPAVVEAVHVPKASTVKAMNWYQQKQAAARAAASAPKPEAPAVLVSERSSDTVLDMSRRRATATEQSANNVVQLVGRRPAAPEAPRSRATIKQMLSKAAARVRQVKPAKPAPVYSTVAAERQTNAGVDLSKSVFAAPQPAQELATVTNIESRRRPRVARAAALVGAALVANIAPSAPPSAHSSDKVPSGTANATPRADHLVANVADSQNALSERIRQAVALSLNETSLVRDAAPARIVVTMPAQPVAASAGELSDQQEMARIHRAEVARQAATEERNQKIAQLTPGQVMGTMRLIQTGGDPTNPMTPDGRYEMVHTIRVGEPEGEGPFDDYTLDSGSAKSLDKGVLSLTYQARALNGIDNDVTAKDIPYVFNVHHMTPIHDENYPDQTEALRRPDDTKIADPETGQRGDIMTITQLDGSMLFFEAIGSDVAPSSVVDPQADHDRTFKPGVVNGRQVAARVVTCYQNDAELAAEAAAPGQHLPVSRRSVMSYALVATVPAEALGSFDVNTALNTTSDVLGASS